MTDRTPQQQANLDRMGAEFKTTRISGLLSDVATDLNLAMQKANFTPEQQKELNRAWNSITKISKDVAYDKNADYFGD